jgi:hypothetical protein
MTGAATTVIVTGAPGELPAEFVPTRVYVCEVTVEVGVPEIEQFVFKVRPVAAVNEGVDAQEVAGLPVFVGVTVVIAVFNPKV